MNPGCNGAATVVFVLLTALVSGADAANTPSFAHPPDMRGLAAPFQARGPRTSPFTPPEETDINFVTDVAPGLDTPCTFSSGSPLSFNIEITRHVGPTNVDGTLANADTLIAAGLLSDTATLIIPAFDVDSEAVPEPPFVGEIDRVTFNGEEIGFLAGQNDTWVLNSFEIDIRSVKFPARGANGMTPTAALNQVEINIDVGNFPTQVWCTAADWGAHSFKTMSPAILIHGNNSDGGFFQRRGFTGALDAQNLLFDNSISMQTDTIANNGTQLRMLIPAIVRSYGVDSVHLVAHSKGGLDSREYLAKYYPQQASDFEVLSYSTLSTPHNGSVLADVALARDRAAMLATETEFSGFPDHTDDVLAAVPTDVGTTNLSTAFVGTFNASNLPLVNSDVVINTTYADADTNDNAQIDRNPDEYAELRAESQALQDLDNEIFGQRKSRIAVDVPYQVLRNTASVTITTRTENVFFGLGGTRTIATLTSNPNPVALGNDVLVTIPSGRGDGSVAGRTTNTQGYIGANGRNHSSIANAGVGQQVAQWLIEIERQKGDLQ